MSLFWRGYSVDGAIASILVGFISIPFFKFVMQDISGIGAYFSALEALPPAFVASLLSGYFVSKLRPQKDLTAIYVEDLKTISATSNIHADT